MSSPTSTVQRHVAPIVGRVVTHPSSDLAFKSTPDKLDALRAERSVSHSAGQIADRNVTHFSNPGSQITNEIAVIASASNTLNAPKGATGPAIRHQSGATSLVADEIARFRPDIVVVASTSIDPQLSAAAKAAGATIKRLPIATK